MIRSMVMIGIISLVVAIGYANQPVAENDKSAIGQPKPEPPDSHKINDEFKPVYTRGLHIINDRGTTVASLVPASNGAGLWLTHKDGPMIAIYTIDEQAAIGLYESKNPKGAMPLALWLKDGRPMLQVRDASAKNDETKNIDLLKLAEQHK